MFLDDQIVEMVVSRYDSLTDHGKMRDLLFEILDLCGDRFKKEIDESGSDDRVHYCVKKVSNLFDSAANILEKKGYPFLSQGGFIRYLKLDDGMKEILVRYGF